MTHRNSPKTLWTSAVIALLAGLLSAGSTGCAATPLQRARTLLARGDFEGATGAAGESWSALQAVSFAALEDALRREETRGRALRAVLGAGEAALPLASTLFESDDLLSSTVGAALIVDTGADEQEEAARALRSRLSHDDAMVRAVAVRVLGARPGSFEVIDRALEARETVVLPAVVHALSRRAQDDLRGSTVRLAAIFESDAPAPVRARALRILGRYAEAAVVDDLAEDALATNSTTLHLAAAAAFARRADEAPVALRLHAMVESDDGAVALRATIALAAVGDAAAVERMDALLRGGDRDEAILAAIGAAQVGPSLGDALVAALGRSDAGLRLRAAASLRALGRDGESRAALSVLLDDRGWVGLQAALILARDGDDAALGRLAHAASSPDAERRAFVAAACVGLPGGLDVARLGLSDRSATVRLSAAATVLRFLEQRG